MLEKMVRVDSLYDFYGQLLTEKQRHFFELYYEQDLSLGEIAGEYGISRQAVYDILRRTENILEKYEARLGLLGRHLADQERLREGLQLADALLAQITDETTETREKLARLREIIGKMLAQ